MAFVRFKGPYAYLVENERVDAGGESRVRQRVLCYLGRDVAVDDDLIKTVAKRFPDAKVDWEKVRLALGPRRPAAPGKKRQPREEKRANDEWLAWD
jgi:hypothetical protein